MNIEHLKCKINLDQNILLQKSGERISFSYDINIYNNQEIRDILILLKWSEITYLKSNAYYSEHIFNNINVKHVERIIDIVYFQFKDKLILKIINMLKDRNIEFNLINNTFIDIKSNNLKEISEYLKEVIEKETLIFLEELPENIVSIKYIFGNNNQTELNFKITLNGSSVSVKNKSKYIDPIFIKRALNRLSILSNQILDSFKLIKKGVRPKYKAFYAGRRNVFEKIDLSIIKSIVNNMENEND